MFVICWWRLILTRNQTLAPPIIWPSCLQRLHTDNYNFNFSNMARSSSINARKQRIESKRRPSPREHWHWYLSPGLKPVAGGAVVGAGVGKITSNIGPRHAWPQPAIMASTSTRHRDVMAATASCRIQPGQDTMRVNQFYCSGNICCMRPGDTFNIISPLWWGTMGDSRSPDTRGQLQNFGMLRCLLLKWASSELLSSLIY